MDWIITIKREYLDRISSGEKRVEFRRRLPRELKRGDRVFCVGSGSGGHIFLAFHVEGVVRCGVDTMWSRYWHCGGISKSDFFDYFYGQDYAYAMRIAHVIRMDGSLNVRQLGLSRAPQWFAKPHMLPDGL